MKLGLSTSGLLPSKEIFQNYAAAEIECMEISVGADLYENIDYAKTKALADTYGIKLNSIHLPFGNELDISSEDNEIRTYAADVYKKMIASASEIGIKTAVLHPSFEPIEENRRTSRMKNAKNSLAELDLFAYNHSVNIAVENLPRTCLGRNSSDILSLISAGEHLSVCFDTNHLLNEDFSDFISNVGNKIITTHISDYDFNDEKHWLPGEGDIDWNRLLKCLDDIHYNGVFMYELSLMKDTKTVHRTHCITHNDIKSNFVSLMAHQKPEVFGVRI